MREFGSESSEHIIDACVGVEKEKMNANRVKRGKVVQLRRRKKWTWEQ